MTRRTITVLGAGYVGLTTAVVFAHAGYRVYVIEPSEERLEIIKAGRSWFFEEGMDPLIQAALENSSFIPTASYENAVSESSFVFSCVGTPDNPDGSSNLTYVFSAAEEAAKYLKTGSIYVQKSTVPVGTGQKIEALFNQLGEDIHYVSNPEFLREGTAIYDTLFFDRVVAGGRNPASVNEVLNLYMELEKFRDHIAHIAHIPTTPRGDQYIAASLNSAELIKVSSNAFLALKISFANSIALLADQTGADIVEVMNGVGADRRIGQAFLHAGRGYGGGCFPKDVSGLIASGHNYGVDLEIMDAAQRLNESMPEYIVDKLTNTLDGSLNGKRIAVLGLAFKAGTSDVRRSPGIAIANLIQKTGAGVVVYDPQANHEATDDLHKDISVAESIEDATEHADATLIATEWEEFLNYPAPRLVENMAGDVLFDAVNRYDALEASSAGLRYIGVGHKV